MSFTPGTVLGDYEVLGTLGIGGQGSVYRVRHIISQREEALKVLLPDLDDAGDLADRFIREIQVLARLNHPNIAALHTALRLDNQLLMVMELVEGVSLRQKLLSPGVGLWEGINYVLQVLVALEYAHGRGVVHRDIKPSNILISPDSTIKLLDFGIATGQGDRRLTKTGAVVGSVLYMSPEQIRGGPIDARSDLYSVAVMLWQITAGRCPFEGDGDYAVMMAHLEAEPVPPRDRVGVPTALWELLRLALAKKSSHRFQTAAEFRKALVVFRGLGPPSPAEQKTQVETVLMPSTTAGAGPSKSRSATNPSILEEITKQLAVFIGPIAKIIVKRKASKVQDLDELYDTLAKEITSTRDREKFLAFRSRFE